MSAALDGLSPYKAHRSSVTRIPVRAGKPAAFHVTSRAFRSKAAVRLMFEGCGTIRLPLFSVQARRSERAFQEVTSWPGPSVSLFEVVLVPQFARVRSRSHRFRA